MPSLAWKVKPRGEVRPMSDAILLHEPYIRLAAFGGVFALMAAWELFVPRRRQPADRQLRWPGNLGVLVLDALLVRVVFPVTAVGLALVAAARGWGLVNLVDLPSWIAVVAAIVLLDLAIYLQHVLFHAVPALWRLHRMHHADLALDRKSTRLNSSHVAISYAVFCLKKK